MEIQQINKPTKTDTAPLHNAFEKFALQSNPQLVPESQDKPIFLKIEDDQGNLLAGLYGNCYWNGLEIDTLWVDEPLRGQGIGKRLVDQAEQYARRQGAVVSYLKTFDAKHFYEQLGYQVYGELKDRPIGTVLYHMQKRLD